MKIRFVGHASFSVESAGTTLITDPWLIGKAFNNGWALLSPPGHVDWSAIDYIWISHQHPDHLNFPTLKNIAPDQRSRLKVLYQKHASSRVPRVLRGLDYPEVQELPLHRWIRLRHGIDVMCGSVGSMDSWIALRAEGITILNLNDCVMSPPHLAYVSRLVGKVTGLFTQFSFADWIGNHADEKGAAQRKLQDLQFRVQLLAPKFTVPFASFIYFCNRENSWMNAYAVTPQRVADLGLPGANFMYPGDEWDSRTCAFRSPQAIAHYMMDVAAPKTIDPTPEAVDLNKLQDTVDRMLRVLRSRFGSHLIARIPPFQIYLRDQDSILEVNPIRHCTIFRADAVSREEARFLMCSQVAWFAFAYAWGWGAMEISGMYLDRKWRDPFPLAFYLNVLSTEFLDLRSLAQAARTLRFFWAKRQELLSRVRTRFGSGRESDLPARVVAGTPSLTPAADEHSNHKAA